MKRPIIILILSFIGGFFFYEKLEIDLYLVLVLALVSIILFFRYPKYTLICLVTFVLAINYTAYLDLSSRIYINQTYRGIDCKVIDRKKGENSYSYILKINGLKVQYRHKHKYDLGDVLRGDLNFNLVSSKNNYKAFSYRKYLKSKGVFLVAKGDLSLTEKKDFLYSIRGAFKDYVEKNIDKSLQGQANDFAKSIILAENRMEESINDKYKDLGMSHILAVSGLHLSVLIYSFELIASFFGLKREIHIGLVSIFLLAYGFLIAYPISLIRTLIMFIIRWLALYSEKIFDRLNSIFVALFILLVINPYYLYSSSLYFSFAAIFSIFYIKDLLKFSLRLKKSWLDALMTTISIQLGMLPLQIYYFDRLNLLTILANLLLLPLAFIAILVSFILGLVSLDLFFIGKTLLETCIYLINTTLDSLGQIKFMSLTFSNLSPIKISIYYFFLILLLNLHKFKKNKRREILIWTGLCLSLLVAFSFYRESRILCRIDFIDVGQGDAILIRSRDKKLMVDVGGDFLNKERSSKDLSSFLYKNGIDCLDALFLTHDDYDHVGNYEYLSKELKIDKVYAISDFKSLDTEKIDFLKLGQKLYFGALELEVLSGNKNKEKDKKNESSLGMILRANKTSILLMGDIEKAEMGLAKEKVDILKLGHHGSKKSSSDDFLEITRPREAIISVGLNNSYGHPDPGLIERLKKRSINIYKTSTDGQITVFCGLNGYYIDYYYKKYDIFDLVKSLLLY
ncbi:MAG: DNA internalization-related competence protein ComEC/Rec2 [Tissierellia bacterium]|nr:DNA internalization-related competence protein ComEC/Rec2 [Tissierellia bacterium]